MIKNDLPQMQGSALYHKLRDYTQLSFSYLLLLVASSVITTLGLLVDNSSVIIGGMIIAPLMWPLLKVSFGISFDNRPHVREAIGLLIISVLIGVSSAFVIAFISPFKQLNSEILSRTTPTLIDLIIAIFAGIVASFAVLRPKISDTLAGVAIAASLMPPLAVSGIGLALLNTTVFLNSLLLFFVNVLAIIFVSIIVFSFLTNRLHPADFLKRKSFLIVFIGLALTSIPLIYLLRSYSFEVSAYSGAQQVLTESLADISSSFFVSNISLNINSPKKVTVSAEILVPEGQTITFDEQELLIKDLSKALGRDVDLNLRLQNTISLVTKEATHQSLEIDSIRGAFITELAASYPLMTVDSVEITDIGASWQLKSTLRTPRDSYFDVIDLKKVQSAVETTTEKRVELVLDVIPRSKLRSADSNEQIQNLLYVQNLVNNYSNRIDVSSFYKNNSQIYLELRVPADYSLDYVSLKKDLQLLFGSDSVIEIVVTTKQIYN